MPVWLLPFLLKWVAPTVGLAAAPSVISKLFGVSNADIAAAGRKKQREASLEEGALQMLIQRGAPQPSPEELSAPVMNQMAKLLAIDEPSREEMMAGPQDPGEALLQQLGYPDRATFRAETGTPVAPALQLMGMTDQDFELQQRYGNNAPRPVPGVGGY